MTLHIRPLYTILLPFFLSALCKGNSVRGLRNTNDGIIDDIPLTTTLSNGVVLPLAGLGVGNLQQDLVDSMIQKAMNDERRIRLFDTSHAAGNDREVVKGITQGIKDLKDQNDHFEKNQPIQVHVVTKVWYTYLGYERTKLAINEILQEYEDASNDPNVDLKITLLIHWPQCFDEIPWMNCEGEEEELPERVKKAGPPPHLNRKDSWKGSWKALEEAYERETVLAGIGISNFNHHTLTNLLEIAKTKPHMAQINIWSLVNETPLIELLKENNIHIQLYNVMNGIIEKIFQNPKAHHHILMVANQLKNQRAIENSSSAEAVVHDDPDVGRVFFAQVILKWIVQFDISVIPRTQTLDHLDENSAVSLSKIPNMSIEQVQITGQAIVAIINNIDLEHDVNVMVRFHAKESDMFLYWIPDEGNNEKQLAFIEKGSSYQESTHPGHVFKVYHAYDPDIHETFNIHGQYGESQDIHVEL